MKIDEYKKVRNDGKELIIKILEFKNDVPTALIAAGKTLGFYDGNIMNFESERDQDILMDFLIYERSKNGIKRIDKFYDSDVVLSEIEEEILESMVNYHASLFEVVAINEIEGCITVIDLFDKDRSLYKVMDIGFSSTAKIEMVFYCRLLPIRDLHITSGVSFGFEKSEKNKIRNEISFAKLKLRKKLNSTDLFLLIHKKSKLYGAEIIHKDVI